MRTLNEFESVEQMANAIIATKDGQPIYLRAAGDCAVEAVRCDGTVAMRFIGPLIGTDYENRFVPALAEALAGQAAG